MDTNIPDEILRREIDDLRHAAEARATIEQAKGVLMFVYQVDAERAFAILRRWSMQHQVKVRALAEALIDIVVEVDPVGQLDSAAHDAVRDGMRRVDHRTLLLEA